MNIYDKKCKSMKVKEYRQAVQRSFQQIVSEYFLAIFGHFVLLRLTTMADIHWQLINSLLDLKNNAKCNFAIEVIQQILCLLQVLVIDTLVAWAYK